MEKINHKYLCWLAGIRGIGKKTKFALLRAAGETSLFTTESDCAEDDCGLAARILYTASEDRLQFLCGEAFAGSARSRKTAQILLKAQKQEADRIEEELERAGIIFVSALERGFPLKLREIPDPPFGIYCKGTMPAENEPAAAIIGARLASGYGREQARRFGRRIGARGISVISGMARGIDGIAQKAALDAGGKSYAVLGCGVDICYPEENRELYERLLKEGGVLSEYPPGTFPEARLFPPRNRIISGLSDLVLVIEARKKSGTLITVDMALEQGRDVYALPGRVSDSLSDGCNRLIRQGAGAATCPEDILEFFYGPADTEKHPADTAIHHPDIRPHTAQEKMKDEESGNTCKESEKELAIAEPAADEKTYAKKDRAARGMKRPLLEDAILTILSKEDEMHLERILEALGRFSEYEDRDEGPEGTIVESTSRNISSFNVSLAELISAMMHLKLEGKAEESAPGYFRAADRTGE